MMHTEDLSAFIQGLKHPDPGERRTAAEALSDADERALYPLIRALRDDNPGVQDAAMRSLAAIGGEVAAYMALPLLREGPFLRNTARVILRQIGRASVPLLRPLMLDKDDDIRTFAVDLIADIGWCDYPRAIAQLLETDPNRNVRSSAALALGVLGCREVVPALIAALHDDEWVCFSVLEALAAIGDEAAVEPVGALLGSPSEALRYAAVETLGKIGSPRSCDLLLGRLEKADDSEKNAVVKSLVLIGINPSTPGIADTLLTLFKNGDWDDRLIALAGLADLKDDRAIPVILDVAGSLDPSDPENEDRLSASKDALGKFGCMPRLIAALYDPALKFRGKVMAIEVIGKLGCPDAVPPLARLMEGDLREVRRASALALAEILDDEAMAVLRRSVGDRDGHVRRAAIAALGRIGDAASFRSLLDRLAVENYADVLEETVQSLLLIDAKGLFEHLGRLGEPVKEIIGRYAVDCDILLALSREACLNVKVSALSGLGRVRDGRAYRRLAEALRDTDAEVRKAAVLAIGRQDCCFDDLQYALRDDDMWVRLYAVRALGESPRPGVAALLSPLLGDKHAPVVIAAIDALVQLGEGAAVMTSGLRNHPDAAVRERAAQVTERL